MCLLGNAQRALGAVILAVFLPVAASSQEVEPYAPTLGFGAGLVRTPVAWVSPRSGDFGGATSAAFLSGDGRSWNANGALESHWGGRVTLGLSVYSNNPEWGVFGSALLLEEDRASVLPAIAVGFRNLGPYRSMDRLQVSYAGIGSSGDRPLPYASNLRTAPTFYGVATKTATVAAVEASFSVGYGNGIFSDDGDLGSAYNRRGTIADGLFVGARAILWSQNGSSIALVAENDGWDWNAGLIGSWRRFIVGVYATELEEGTGSNGGTDPLRHYNYTKLNVSLGYKANVFEVAGRSRMRSRVSELEQERLELRGEIARREDQIGRLEAQLRTTQAGELAEILDRRRQLEARIEEEREAIRRAEERLRQLETPRTPQQQRTLPDDSASTQSPLGGR